MYMRYVLSVVSGWNVQWCRLLFKIQLEQQNGVPVVAAIMIAARNACKVQASASKPFAHWYV